MIYMGKVGKDGNLIPLCTHEWSKSKATAGLNWTKEKSHQGFLCMKLRFRVSGRIGIKNKQSDFNKIRKGCL
jgi:hypothetical protein